MLRIRPRRTVTEVRLCPPCRWDTTHNIHTCNLLVGLVLLRGCIQVLNTMPLVVGAVDQEVLLVPHKVGCRTCLHEMRTIQHSHHQTRIIRILLVEVPGESNNVVTLMGR